jgi:hypothetical protein
MDTNLITTLQVLQGLEEVRGLDGLDWQFV